LKLKVSHLPLLQQRFPQFPSRRHLLFLFSAFLLVLVWCGTLPAIPVGDYRKNIEQVIGALDTVNVQDEHESVSAYQARFTWTVNAIRTVLPPKQTVEWTNTTYNVDNSWLHQGLEEFEKAAEPDRRKLLVRILERLKALDERLDEIERSSAGAVEDKNEAKRKLNEILARGEYATKPQETSALSRLWQRFLRWLLTLFGRRGPAQASSSRLITNLSQVFVVVLALIVIIYVLRMFAPRLRRTRGSKKRGKPEPRVILGERLEPDQSAVDLLSEAEALARKGEIRAAIRKGYIALLVELGERHIISLAQYKTNRDYLRSVRERVLLHERMLKLTDSFERHWYGLAQANDSDWKEFRARYREALQE
jgi:hypothetical protein